MNILGVRVAISSIRRIRRIPTSWLPVLVLLLVIRVGGDGDVH